MGFRGWNGQFIRFEWGAQLILTKLTGIIGWFGRIQPTIQTPKTAGLICVSDERTSRHKIADLYLFNYKTISNRLTFDKWTLKNWFIKSDLFTAPPLGSDLFVLKYWGREWFVYTNRGRCGWLIPAYIFEVNLIIRGTRTPCCSPVNRLIVDDHQTVNWFRPVEQFFPLTF